MIFAISSAHNWLQEVQELHAFAFWVAYSKGATKLYFMYYSRVVIILFSEGLCKSAFSTCSYGKTRFSSFCFGFLFVIMEIPH